MRAGGELSRLARRLNVRTIFVTWRHDPHPDHIAAALIAAHIRPRRAASARLPLSDLGAPPAARRFDRRRAMAADPSRRYALAEGEAPRAHGLSHADINTDRRCADHPAVAARSTRSADDAQRDLFTPRLGEFYAASDCGMGESARAHFSSRSIRCVSRAILTACSGRRRSNGLADSISAHASSKSNWRNEDSTFGSTSSRRAHAAASSAGQPRRIAPRHFARR